MVILEVVSAAMPTYDYSCRSCGARFEAWQKMSDDPIAVCPTCGGPVRRILYPVGLVFKGAGFYSTDNRGASNGTNGGPDGTSSGPDGAQGEARKEASPAASAPGESSAGAASGTKAAPAASTASTASTTTTGAKD